MVTKKASSSCHCTHTHTHTHTHTQHVNPKTSEFKTQAHNQILERERQRERAVICKYSSINILEDIYIYIYSHIIKKYFFPSTFQFYSHLHDVSKISKIDVQIIFYIYLMSCHVLLASQVYQSQCHVTGKGENWSTNQTSKMRVHANASNINSKHTTIQGRIEREREWLCFKPQTKNK